MLFLLPVSNLWEKKFGSFKITVAENVDPIFSINTWKLMMYFFRNDKIAYDKLFLLTNSTTVHVPFVMGILDAIGKKAI